MLRSGIVYSRRSYDKVKEGGNGIFCPVKEVVIHVLQWWWPDSYRLFSLFRSPFPTHQKTTIQMSQHNITHSCVSENKKKDVLRRISVYSVTSVVKQENRKVTKNFSWNGMSVCDVTHQWHGRTAKGYITWFVCPPTWQAPNLCPAHVLQELSCCVWNTLRLTVLRLIKVFVSHAD